MKLIVGLGNPGKEYERTRHNVGFDLVDVLAVRWSVEVRKKKFNGRFGSGQFGLEAVMLLKPQTYMNLSGQSVLDAFMFHKLGQDDLLVVNDDMALPLGQIRLRQRGSDGGHNGLKDIVRCLGHSDFDRLRIGIGASRFGDSTNHVLGRFEEAEQEALDEAIVRCALAVECWVENGAETTMNKFNVSTENRDKEPE